MDELTERITVLLTQEQAHYRCRDYMPKESVVSDTPIVEQEKLVSMVEECASLVTDTTRHRNTFTKSSSELSLTDVQHLKQQDKTPEVQKTEQSFGFWRQQMFDWACMVVDSFHMDREVVAVSFNLLDRFVAMESSKPKAPKITRDDFQLFSMTCLYTAIKILEPYPRKLGVQALMDMSRGFYNEQDIVVTEQEILKSLQWYVNPTTAIGFARLFGALLPTAPSAEMQMTYATITEIAVADPFFISYKPSLIGLAAVLHAARLDGRASSEMDQLVSCTERMIQTQDHEDFQTVYRQLERLYCH